MTVLLAAEDDELREILADSLLLRDGVTVVEAADAGAAVRAAAGPPDLLIVSATIHAACGASLPERPRIVLDSGDAGDALIRIDAWFAEHPPDGGIPERLGDYELLEWLGRTELTDIYRAVQRSVNREVTVERLRPEYSADRGTRAKFRRMVRARAAVTHPHIGTVFEAQESGDSLFYTRERLRGSNLEELVAAGAVLGQTDLLGILRVAGEAFGWLDEHGTARDPFRPGHIVVGEDNVPRVSNTAQPDQPPEDPVIGISRLAEAVAALGGRDVARAPEVARILALAGADGPQAVRTWKALAREARTAADRLLEAHTATSVDPSPGPPVRRIEWSRPLLSLAAILTVAAASWTATAWFKRMRRTAVRDHTAMVHIPAGPFVFRDGRSVDLPEFWIDKYEVSLARYAAFLDALPHGDPARFDHPDQPPAKTSHVPADWERIYSIARKAGVYRGQTITLNSPVFNVDWWDAWAFARWLDRRLPSDEEWEKAARGIDGRLFPWGDEPDVTRTNTAAPGDGFACWSEVDAMPGDVSPWGVIGMAGNVAEWTSTLAQHPDLPDVQVPVFRGGGFHLAQPVPLSARPWLARDALYVQPFLGFRTASSKPPP